MKTRPKYIPAADWHDGWCVDCQVNSHRRHRFDCRAAPEDQRGAGPFLPTTAPTTAELVAPLRMRTVPA